MRNARYANFFLASAREMALRGQLSALLHALSLAALARAQTGSITLVESDNAFEHEVMEGESCWAVLFVSNVPTEPTEHWQMRFELASASLADRVRLGIVAVHDAPNATAEFLTTTTPQIGACSQWTRGLRSSHVLPPASARAQCSSSMTSALASDSCSRRA